jgi:ligand-binding sensor domain-containing protein
LSIYSLLSDSRGYLWIGTQGRGIDIIDLKKQGDGFIPSKKLVLPVRYAASKMMEREESG